MPTLTDEPLAGGSHDPPSIDDFDGFLAAATLLRNPRLARSYVYVCYYGPTTVQEIIETLDLARATAYDDVEELETLGVLTREEDTRPHKLTADPFAFVDEDSLAITPTVLHAVALTEIDEDAEYFQSRHGTARLVQAVRVAGEHYAGGLTQRMAAEKLDVPPVEGMAIVQSLQPALAAGQQFDPYFDRLFPEIHGEIAIDGDVTGGAVSNSDGESSASDE